MGDLREFSLATRLFLRAYPWRRVDPVPWAPLRCELASARVALVTAAGLVLPEQAPFDGGIRGGDSSFRWIPADTHPACLVDTHRSGSFSHEGLRADPNLGLPLDRLHELAARGRIGAVAPRHVSLMGSITAPGRLVRDTLPEVGRQLAADGVDAALLVPV